MNVVRMEGLDLAGKRVFIRADFNVPQDAEVGSHHHRRTRFQR